MLENRVNIVVVGLDHSCSPCNVVILLGLGQIAGTKVGNGDPLDVVVRVAVVKLTLPGSEHSVYYIRVGRNASDGINLNSMP